MPVPFPSTHVLRSVIGCRATERQSRATPADLSINTLPLWSSEPESCEKFWNLYDKLLQRFHVRKKSGEQVADDIRIWIGNRYTDGMDWQSEQFHCFGDLPIEFRMIPAFDVLEYNIGNGGWAQLLWNCFGTWRQVISTCEAGCHTIGSNESLAALGTLRQRLETNEEECRQFMQRYDSEQNFDCFSEFTSRSYARPGDEWQSCFDYDSPDYAKRHSWLADNAAQLAKTMKSLN